MGQLFYRPYLLILTMATQFTARTAQH